MAAKKPVVRKKPAKGKVPPQFAKNTVAPATVPKKGAFPVAKKGRGKMPAGLAAFLAKKKTGK